MLLLRLTIFLTRSAAPRKSVAVPRKESAAAEKRRKRSAVVQRKRQEDLPKRKLA